MAAVTIDGTGTVATQGSSAGALTIKSTTLTVSSSATVLVALLGLGGGSSTITSVTWDTSTQTMTQLATINSTVGTASMSIYGLLSPHIGNLILNATWTGAKSSDLIGLSFFNSATDTIANCFPNTTTKSSNGANASITVTSKTSDIAVSGFCQSAVNFVSINQTQIWLDNSHNASAGARSSGAATVTFTCSDGGASTPYAAAAVDISGPLTTTSEDQYHQPWSSVGRKIYMIATRPADREIGIRTG